MNIKETKDQARALVDSLAGFGIRLKHQQALEVLSRVKGAKGWSQLIAGESGPKSAALSTEQRAILDEAVRIHLSTKGVPDVGHPVKIVMAGDVFGNLNSVDGYYADRTSGKSLEISLVFTPYYSKAPYAPSVHFLSAILANKDGKCVVESYALLDYNALLNEPVDIELRYNNTACRSICPLTLQEHKPFCGVYPFLAGTWDPIDREILPARVWEAADAVSAGEENAEAERVMPGTLDEFSRLHLPFRLKDDHRLRLTVGEIKAEMDRAGSSSYGRPNRHLCEVCGEDVTVGDHAVCVAEIQRGCTPLIGPHPEGQDAPF